MTAEQIIGLSLALLVMCFGTAGSILPGIPGKKGVKKVSVPTPAQTSTGRGCMIYWLFTPNPIEPKSR